MDVVHHKFVKEIDISILLVQRKLDQNQNNNSSVFFFFFFQIYCVVFGGYNVGALKI